MRTDKLLAYRVGGNYVYVTAKLFLCFETFLKALCQSAYLMGIGDKLMSPLCQSYGVIYSFKQETVKLVLKLLYLKGNGGL
jgi:hypothetical protein